MRLGEARELGDVLDARRNGETAGAHREGRKLVTGHTQHGHADRFQVFERARQVEERLGTGAHRHHWVRGECAEVGRNVAVFVDAAVHAANAAGGEHRNTCSVGEQQRRRHRGGTEIPALCDGEGELALTDLAGGTEDESVLRFVEAHPRHATDDGGDCRHCTSSADRSKAAVQRFGVLRGGEPEVGKDRGLECHDRAA
jgi:hypothetical protein